MKISSVIILILSTCWPALTAAVELKTGGTYRLGITMTKLKSIGDLTTEYTALKNSKYFIVSKSTSGEYIVRFDNIFTSDAPRYTNENYVLYDKLYILKDITNPTVPISSISKPSNTGLSSGPLLVPFKYRLNDNSLSGDATVGFYAGITFELGCFTENWCFRITPLLSAGISQVAVAKTDGSGTESQSSATWAAGFLITDWANMNIGLIYGQDRIGDKSWEFEGKGWLSFMIGWQL